jgi:hypothetical protein
LCQKHKGKYQRQQAVNREEEKSQTQEIPFETALLHVSHCLTEAEACAERGSLRKATHLFHLAEVYALRTGYVELLSLVWSYDSCFISYAAPPCL